MGNEENTSMLPAEEREGTKESPENKPAAKPADSESVQILHGALGLFTTPEVGPETEEEIKTKHELNDVVHRMLIIGLVLSTTVLFIGLAMSAITHQPVPSKVLSFHELYHGLARGSAPSILSLGILLLIATPVLRVFGSLIEFILKRDWRFAFVTGVVLLILSISVFFGKG